MVGTKFSYNESRALVVQLGVNVEEAISILLCRMLNIEISQSVAFGTSSFSLSFNNKITLLTDLKILSKTDKKYFDYFMQIRNKFAHVKSIDSFSSCDKHCGKSSPFVYLKKFEENSYENEEQYLNQLFRLLYVKIQAELLKLLLEIEKTANTREQNIKNSKLLNKATRLATEIVIQRKKSINTKEQDNELIKLLDTNSLHLTSEEEKQSLSKLIELYPSLWETLIEI